jgi:uncharacterized protein (DUF2062 family)
VGPSRFAAPGGLPDRRGDLATTLRKSGAAIQVFLTVMMHPLPKNRPDRPWWRTPFRYLLRVRPRPRHVHGTFLHRLLGERLLVPALWLPQPDSLARGGAVGMFSALLPFPGQSLLAIILCYMMRGNIALAVLATFISNPLTTPAILWIQFKAGQWLLPAAKFLATDDYSGADWYFDAYAKPFLLGSITTALAAGLVAYPVFLGLSKLLAWLLERRRERLAKARAARALWERPAKDPLEADE